jgi:hypothetical protein
VFAKGGEVKSTKDFIRAKSSFADGGDVKKLIESGRKTDLPEMLSKEGKFKAFEPAEKKPLGKKSGKPITDQGPSAMDVASFINSFLPVTGDIQSAAEGYQAFKDKDYVGASLGALGALPFVPGMTTIVKGTKQLSNSLPPEGVPKKIWDLHETVRKYDDPNFEFLNVAKGDNTVTTGEKNRRRTVAYKKLKKAIEEEYPDSKGTSYVYMGNLNEISAKREALDFENKMPMPDVFKHGGEVSKFIKSKK